VAQRDVRSLAGTVLARRYQLLELIGDGGMGKVYRAAHLSTGGMVALKVMDAWDSDDATVARFRHEAETTALLTHPNTVRLIDFGYDDDLYYLVVEYVPGQDLNHYLRPGGQDQHFAVHVLYQTVASLAEAHGRGLVHRDIKPSNIRIQDHPGHPCFVRLIDWGIARTVEGLGHGTLGVIGTLGYIAPEQIRDGGVIDARTDLYALGCLAYELISGRLPFEGVSHTSAPMRILQAHLNSAPTPLHLVRAGIHPELASGVMALLQNTPEKRPRSALDVLSRLDGVRADLEGRSFGGLPPPSRPPGTLPPPPPSGRGPEEALAADQPTSTFDPSAALPAGPMTAAYESEGPVRLATLGGGALRALTEAVALGANADAEGEPPEPEPLPVTVTLSPDLSAEANALPAPAAAPPRDPQGTPPKTSAYRPQGHATPPPIPGSVGAEVQAAVAEATAALQSGAPDTGELPPPSARAPRGSRPSMIAISAAILALMAGVVWVLQAGAPTRPMAQEFLILSTPPGASIREGDQGLGSTPVHYRLRSGRAVVLTARLDGHSDQAVELPSAADPNGTVTVSFDPAALSTEGGR